MNFRYIQKNDHNRAGTSVLFLQLQVIFHQQKYYNKFDKCRCSQFPSSVSIREKE